MKRIKRVVCLLLVLCTLCGIAAVPANAGTVYVTSVDTERYATLKNVGSKKMLNVYGNRSANNTNITVYQSDGTSGQDVRAYEYNGYYYFTFRCSPKRALNIYGDHCYANANCCLWDITEHPTQLWELEYVPSKQAYILRSIDNAKYCLTACGSANSSNVCIKEYNGSDYQLWTSSLFSNVTSPSSTTTLTVSAIKSQIQNTYSTAKKLAGKSSFNGWCGLYVKTELQALGIIGSGSKDSDCNGNGNQWYSNVKSGKTSTGYTKTKVSGGSNCLANLVKQYGNTMKNIVISYPHQYGYTDKNPGAGHVVFIHAIINGTVYYSESYATSGIAEGGVLTKSVSAFDSAYTSSYGKALGAIIFTK